ncbi:MAG: hypothetical protein M1835_001712, partial [Candelina submexicana]
SNSGRSRRESPSSNTHDLTVTVSTIDQRAKANILYGRDSRLIRPSSDETWSSQFNLSASYSTNSVGSFAKFHTETSGLLEPDEADREVRAGKASSQSYEATPSPVHESSFPTRLPLSTRISLFQPAPTRNDPKMVPKDSHVDDIQVRVGIELDHLSRRHGNLESHENKTCEEATVSLGPDQARRTGTPMAAYWIEDRRLGNGAVYNSSTTSDPHTPGHGPVRNNNTPTKYIDRGTAPEGYFLRNLPEPRIRVLTEDDADFYDDSSYEGDSESDNDELSAKDIAILDSAEDFRAHDSGLGGSHGGVSLPASHQSLKSLPEEASSPQRIDESSSPTSIYSRSEESDGGSNHTIHVDSTPGNSSGSGDTLVSIGVQSSPSHSMGTPIHPVIGGAGEMTLGELAAYLAGPRAAENLQDGAASMTVQVPIMGMPPGNFRSPQPKSLIQVKEIRRLVFRWSSDSPIVEVKLERTPS